MPGVYGNSYYGTPKFAAETLSPSTVKRDRGIKMNIYEVSGVEEYWIVSPIERAVEIYYLRDGKSERTGCGVPPSVAPHVAIVKSGNLWYC